MVASMVTSMVASVTNRLYYHVRSHSTSGGNGGGNGDGKDNKPEKNWFTTLSDEIKAKFHYAKTIRESNTPVTTH